MTNFEMAMKNYTRAPHPRGGGYSLTADRFHTGVTLYG